jgi:hypothetical protein
VTSLLQLQKSTSGHFWQSNQIDDLLLKL